MRGDRRTRERAPAEGPSAAQAALLHASLLRQRGRLEHPNRSDLVRSEQLARMAKTESDSLRKRERAFRELLLGACRDLVRGASTQGSAQRDARLRLLGLMDDMERAAAEGDAALLVLTAEAVAVYHRTCRSDYEPEPPARRGGRNAEEGQRWRAVRRRAEQILRQRIAERLLRWFL